MMPLQRSPRQEMDDGMPAASFTRQQGAGDDSHGLSNVEPLGNYLADPELAQLIPGSQTAIVESIAALGFLTLPTFWKDQPDLWFCQVEAQFDTRNIRSDSARYNHVLSALSPDVLKHISDVLTRPPPTDRYRVLKETLIKRLSDSRDRQLTKLLTGLELGDRKPSQLLREMRRLAEDTITDDVLATLWLRCLPAGIRGILSASQNVNLESQADIADRILETMSSATVLSTDLVPRIPTISHSTGNIEQRFRNIEALLREMQKTMKDLQTKSNDQSSFFRNLRRSRSFSKFPSRGENGGICFYHQRFGTKATKCRDLCKFSSLLKRGNEDSC